jgi:predicted nucleotidyltransferase
LPNSLPNSREQKTKSLEGHKNICCPTSRHQTSRQQKTLRRYPNMLADSQKPIQDFLEELSSKVGDRFGDRVDFVLLFGSAARGEWKQGISDVDLIIQVADERYVDEVRDFVDSIFWELDLKHDTGLREACSTGNSEDRVKRLISKTKLYVPYDVFGPEDIDWEDAQIKRKDLALGAKLVASQAMLFKKMKIEGKILYGRDVREVIQVDASLWERMKALLIPYTMALLSSLGALILPKTALKVADKAAIYSIESSLFFMDLPVGRGIEKATEEWERELRHESELKLNLFNVMEIDSVFSFDYRKLVHFDFAREAIELKYNWAEKSSDFGRWSTLRFCLKSLLFVNSMNWYAILRRFGHAA